MTAISQKEYLKKYLGIGKAPGEKKKKKKKAVGDRLKVIDDDSDVLISREIEEDISAANEDAPQIVAVIDERPPSLRIDEQTKSNLWKPIGISEYASNETKIIKLSTSFKLNKQLRSSSNSIQSESKSSYKLQKTLSEYESSRVRVKEEKNFSPKRSRDTDISPPRVRSGSSSNYSPPRQDIKIEREISSPRRKHNEKDNSSSRKKVIPDSSPNRSDGDYSPPRKMYRDDSSSSSRRQVSDYSPPGQRHQDHSFPRKYRPESPPPLKEKESQNNDDNTPPRQRDRDQSPPRKRRYEEDNSPQRRQDSDKRDNDNSPPRRKIEDFSPPRRSNREKDISPPRKRNKEDYSPRIRSSRDISPPRRKHQGDMSPKKLNRKDSVSPLKNRRKEQAGSSKEKTSRWGDWSPETSPKSPPISDKMKKTLDGKTAGLQNAEDLVKETTLLKQREDEIFRKMSAEVSGRNAATVVRAKKTDQDPEEITRQLEKEKRTKEKYDRWGKGMKQVEEQNERRADQLHEMSKPLARYADDEDLERYLKEQEREGDPMLNYIRKKKKSKAVASGVPEKPMYMGEFMPNRFGIRPGYRWDGVDRSNGYEKKWFQVQNAKKASQEDAFKWSTEDM